MERQNSQDSFQVQGIFNNDLNLMQNSLIIKKLARKKLSVVNNDSDTEMLSVAKRKLVRQVFEFYSSHTWLV